MSVPAILGRDPFGAAQGSRAITRATFFVHRCISPLSVAAPNRPAGPGEHHSAGAGVVQGEVCWEGVPLCICQPRSSQPGRGSDSQWEGNSWVSHSMSPGALSDEGETLLWLPWSRIRPLLGEE